MLSTIYRQHTERVTVLKQKQGSFHSINDLMVSALSSTEKKKKELLASADQLTRIVVDELNNE